MQHYIHLKKFETPLGTMIACATENGICLFEFGDREMLATELKSVAKAFNATILAGESLHFKKLEQEVNEYFAGKLKDFTVPLVLQGSDFQKHVWQVLQNIPYGKTRSYKEQAIAIGKPEAIRAVANANGMNKIAIIIPCHRVIGTNGTLTGYGGGLWRKKYLLELEQTEVKQGTLIF